MLYYSYYSKNKMRSVRKIACRTEENTMNIALLNDSFPPLIDGVANTVVNYARYLNSGADRALVVTPEYPQADDSAFPYPVLRYPGLDARKLTGYIAGYPFSPRVERELAAQPVELLHSHCPISSTLLARGLQTKLDVPLVMTYHTKFDIDIANIISSRLLQDAAVTALVDNITACDEVWVVSRGAGENLRSLGYEGEYVVMENGVDMPRGRLPEAETAALTAEAGLPAGVPVYLFVGRLMWYKGLRLILDALAALRSQRMDFRMVFVGGGADEREIRAYAAERGLGDRVIFTGPIHDRKKLSAWYCRADLFLFPSTFDTNGLVVHEAAACFLPAVLVQDSCAAEPVTDGHNGFLIEENAASLAVCLTRLYEHPERVREVGAMAGAELYLSWEEAVRRARERYAVVIDNYRSGKYPPHRRVQDEFFRMQGDLMELVARADDWRSEWKRRMDRYL